MRKNFSITREEEENGLSGNMFSSLSSVSLLVRKMCDWDSRRGNSRATRASSTGFGNRFRLSIPGCKGRAFIVGALAWLGLLCVLLERTAAVRPLKEKGLGIEHSPLLDQWLVAEGSGGMGPYPMLNISGTYKGTWLVRNVTARFSDFRKTMGNIIFELTSSPTDIRGVHYVQVGNLSGMESAFVEDCTYSHSYISRISKTGMISLCSS